jgi:hypothetical protein
MGGCERACRGKEPETALAMAPELVKESRRGLWGRVEERSD